MKEKLRWVGTLQETSTTDEFSVDVPVNGVDIEAIKSFDKEPMFVTVEVLNQQVSKNKNNWTMEAIESVREQINKIKPDAFMGHLRDEDRAFKAPESQTIWLGSVIKEVAGKSRLFAKGYILPYATKLKQYLQVAKATGKDVGVSVYGLAEIVKNNGVKDILSFDLESIDWARAGSKGTYDTSYLQLTSEMEEIMDKETIISEMTSKDLEKHNAELYKEVKTLGETEASEKVKTSLKEMEDKAKALETTISEMKKVNDELIKSYIVSELEKKITNKATREFINKIVDSELKDKELTKEIADTALKTVLESDNTKAMLKELNSSNKFAPKSEGGEASKDSDYITY